MRLDELKRKMMFEEGLRLNYVYYEENTCMLRFDSRIKTVYVEVCPKRGCFFIKRRNSYFPSKFDILNVIERYKR